MILILLEYLWDICATLVFLLYPLLVYKELVSREKWGVFLWLCLFFYESQLSNTVYYALVWQFNHWLVYRMKLLHEHNAIVIYMTYQLIQFIIFRYGGYVIYLFYLALLLGGGYYGLKNRVRLMEMVKEWNFADWRNKIVTFFIGKLMNYKLQTVTQTPQQSKPSENSVV